VWQAFDQSYSKAFATGKGPNVTDTGVAGVQRQSNITPASGYIGNATFNLLRSIIIPEGLPNAGQHAMDARSVELLNAAYDRFRGTDTPEPPPATSASERLKRAVSQLGVTENPAGTNRQQFGVWYGMNGVPWCAIFCTWCDQTCPHPSKSFVRGSKYSYVPYVVYDARLARNGLSITNDPKPGDLVCYDWGRNGE